MTKPRWPYPPPAGETCDCHLAGTWTGDHPTVARCQHEAIESVYAVSGLKWEMWLCGCCVARLAAQGRIRRNPKRRREPTWKCPTEN